MKVTKIKFECPPLYIIRERIKPKEFLKSPLPKKLSLDYLKQRRRR